MQGRCSHEMQPRRSAEDRQSEPADQEQHDRAAGWLEMADNPGYTAGAGSCGVWGHCFAL